MQEPIRYYITKSGEESTVRSVRVARGERDPDAAVDSAAPPTVEPAKTDKLVPAQASEVKRRVKDAILRRPSDR